MPGWALGLCAIFGALLITLFCCVSPAAICLPAVCCWRGGAGDHLQRPDDWAVYFSTSFDLRQLMYWMMGGFGGVDWQQLWLMIALLPVLCWVCLQSQP
nr:Vitamin B12 import system permease protein BtuC [Klebsiella pneumoniae]